MTRDGVAAVRLVLASASPARLRVLRNAGLNPEVRVSGIDERIEAPSTEALVLELAERKARAVAARCPASLVLGCDSMLEVGGVARGKPQSADEALEMWREQAGAVGTLWTGHCLVDSVTGRAVRGAARTAVRFGEPDEGELAAYVASGEPQRVAGGFTIDGLGSAFVEGVDGDPNNVLGLSTPLLRTLLRELGLAITDLWEANA